MNSCVEYGFQQAVEVEDHTNSFFTYDESFMAFLTRITLDLDHAYKTTLEDYSELGQLMDYHLIRPLLLQQNPV